MYKNKTTTYILIAVMALSFTALSISSIASAEENQNETYDLSPTPSDQNNECYDCELSTTPITSPIPSEEALPSVTQAPSEAPTATVSPTDTPRGGTEEKKEDKKEEQKTEVHAPTFAPTSGGLFNLILGIGLSLLTAGGVYRAKRNIS